MTLLAMQPGCVLDSEPLGGGFEPDGRPPAESVGADDEDPADSAGAIRLDLPVPVETACKKLDVLFVLDNSGSQADVNDELQEFVFPTLSARLLEIGGGVEDFHVAVIDACPYPAVFHDAGGLGDEPDYQSCEFSTGRNWMSSESDDFLRELECVTELLPINAEINDDECMDEVADEDERPMLTAATALTEPLVSGANAGFLRDDALLLLVVIADEDEDDNRGEILPADVLEPLIRAKGGVENIVVLAIGGMQQCRIEGDPYFPAEYPASDARRLRGLVEPFELVGRGIFWDMCAGDIPSAFDAAIDIADLACLEWTPEG